MICIPTSDEEYYQWLGSNEGGYVLNTDKSLKNITYAIQHKATCDHINDDSTPTFTTSRRLKICLTKQGDLEYWLQEYNGIELTLCKSCNS
jgi:hypothetical protein